MRSEGVGSRVDGRWLTTCHGLKCGLSVPELKENAEDDNAKVGARGPITEGLESNHLAEVVQDGVGDIPCHTHGWTRDSREIGREIDEHRYLFVRFAKEDFYLILGALNNRLDGDLCLLEFGDERINLLLTSNKVFVLLGT